MKRSPAELMYDAVAKYFDLIHQDLTEDIEFLAKLSAATDGPILELGCGTGRILGPLARKGHEVTGIDSNAAMLNLAHQKVIGMTKSIREKVTLIKADMAHFDLDQQFKMAIFGYNTFMHLSSSAVDTSLTCVRRHLAPGAWLIIDVDNPYEMADQSEDHLLLFEDPLALPESDQILVRTSSSWLEPEKQLRHLTWLFDRSPRDGGVLHRDVVEQVFHYYYPHQIEIALKRADFELSNTYGDYDCSPFNISTPRMLVLAKAI